MPSYHLTGEPLPKTRLFPELHPLAERLLLARGITTPEALATFLAPRYEDLGDPFLMKNMARAVARIETAIEQGEQIVIYSDYDMDGIPGAVILWDTLRKLGCTALRHYTPHRNREGFGLNREALTALAEDGAKLVITVDCGITDLTPVAHAHSLGLDVIVTDHHLPLSGEAGGLPRALAILNPKQEDCGYPEKNLCGAGVAFTLARALLASAQKRGEKNAPPIGWEKWLLDMAGMATIADMVPLRGENRTLAFWGLVVLRKSRRPGLVALLARARVRQAFLSEEDIAFAVAPRINAASRMGHAQDAFRLLVTEDAALAQELARHLDSINSERKGLVAAMVKEARAKLEEREGLSSVLVVGNPAWLPSLAGLIATALVETYERPVFVWGRGEGETLKGSCRSDGSVHMVALMEAVRELFGDWGGHAGSGGFSIDSGKVHTLESALSEAYLGLRAAQEAELLQPIDAALSLEEVTEYTYRALERLSPFGEGNPRPLFLLAGVVPKMLRRFGKGGEHLEMRFRATHGEVSAIAFFKAPDDYPVVPAPGKSLDLVAHMERDLFSGRGIRLRIVDIR